MFLVDTSVLLDVASADPHWGDWSQSQLEAAGASGALAINAVIYAELSIGFARIEEVEAMLSRTEIVLEEIPRPALFLAGKAFYRYKKRGGSRTSVLPDFFIGAHAAVTGMPLLTRDSRRYSEYFHEIRLITPA